jgi:hypothetical protein
VDGKYAWKPPTPCEVYELDPEPVPSPAATFPEYDEKLNRS